ncbi:MAG: rhomboid family intramembrane serine protease [Desulfobacterales bacterium]|nr:rhomboid family intramembrane serine protease [Desulfobacterales bacterium]
MIPLRDANPSKNFPYVTYFIILLNIFVYFYQLSYGNNQNVFIYTYGLVPARYTNPAFFFHFTPFQQAFSFFSYMFLHGNTLHLITNLWSLYIFGDNIEDHMGHIKYLVFYIMCGFLSGISHLFINLDSVVATIGASGAIAGVMGAYLVLYPRAKLLTLLPVFFIPLFFEIPAFIFLGFWFGLQVFNATSNNPAEVAWWAHIGGFVFGILILKLFSLIPDTVIEKKIKNFSKKKKTPGLRYIKPNGFIDNLNIYATIEISKFEATIGVTKFLNIPLGIHKRILRVRIPKDIVSGSKLVLNGYGHNDKFGEKGDLILNVNVSL